MSSQVVISNPWHSRGITRHKRRKDLSRAKLTSENHMATKALIVTLVSALTVFAAQATADSTSNEVGNLARYAAENAALAKPTAHRVVYFGDSITERWDDEIPGLDAADVINRGISGQTAEEMRFRLKADVLDLKPEVLHLLAGTNDLAGNYAEPRSAHQVEVFLASMALRAKQRGIKVVMASLLPVQKYSWSPLVKPSQSVRDINKWLQTFAARKNFVFVDYYHALVDQDTVEGKFKAGLSDDGVHPNKNGYKIMDKLARHAIELAAQQKSF
jgi:lysophospholipase L1-like esterase